MGDIGTSSGFYSVRPTIEVEGQESSSLADNLLSLLVEETTDGLYRCEATFVNWGPRGANADFQYFDRDELDFGKAFVVGAGDEDAAATLFTGKIYGIEAHYPEGRAPEITVLAEDRLQDLRMTRRTRTFEDVSDNDVFSDIARDHQLQQSIDITGPTHRVLAQLNQSDLAFLRERARAVGAEIWVSDRTLYARSRTSRGDDAVKLTYGRGLYAFSVLADLAMQRTALTIGGWDVETKEQIASEATDAIVQSELNGFQSGAKVLREAFGTRVERVVHMVPSDEDEARSIAEAHFRAVARKFITGRGEAEGDGRLRVGATVDLQGLGNLFDGQYTLTEVRHTIDGNGFRTAFTVERPGIGSA